MKDVIILTQLQQLKKAIEMIEEKVKKPICICWMVAAVAANASAELKEFVEKVDAPVTDSLMGKGAF